MTPVPTVAFDNNGNTLTDAQGRSFTWDFENRLVQAVVTGQNGGTTTFKYDPFGRRIQKSGPLGTTNYLYDGASDIEEVDSSGNTVARYAATTDVDEPLSELRGTAASYYQLDGLGSVTSLSSSTGTAANTYTYDGYGNLAASTGSTTNPFRYTGRDFDQETGLYFYRARYFDASAGRFIGEDPLQFGGGANFYEYGGNNPLLFSDPFGLCKQLTKKGKNCLTKVQAAVTSKLGVPVFYLGPTEFDPNAPGTDPTDLGMRNGAYNFNFVAPGYTPPGYDPSTNSLGDYCGRYSPNFTGVGASLHIVFPVGTPCNPLKDPSVTNTDNGDFSFTAHIDSAFADWSHPLGAVWHGIKDVLLKIKHGC